MATLIYTLPTIAFPHELDYICIGGSGSCTVVVKMGSDAIFSSTLSFNEDGEIELYHFADVIRSYAGRGLPFLQILLDGAVADSCYVIPCAVDLDTTAVAFCPDHFLTRCGRIKSTTPDSEESLSFYSGRSGESIDVVATYALPGGAMLEYALPSSTSTRSDINTYAFKVAEIAAKHEGTLIGFKVSVGERHMEYLVRPEAAAERLRFLNCFGVDEYLAFPEVETKLQTKYSNVRVNGLLTPYKVDQHHEFKYLSGYLLPDELGAFEDVAISPEIERRSDKTPLTVTGCDFSVTTDLYQASQCKLTLRESGRVAMAKTYKRVKTFDKTFDNTFE